MSELALRLLVAGVIVAIMVTFLYVAKRDSERKVAREHALRDVVFFTQAPFGDEWFVNYLAELERRESSSRVTVLYVAECRRLHKLKIEQDSNRKEVTHA